MGGDYLGGQHKKYVRYNGNKHDKIFKKTFQIIYVGFNVIDDDRIQVTVLFNNNILKREPTRRQK